MERPFHNFSNDLQLKKAEEHLLKSADLTKKSNLLLYVTIANQFLGEIYFFMEKYKTSQEFYKINFFIKKQSTSAI